MLQKDQHQKMAAARFLNPISRQPWLRASFSKPPYQPCGWTHRYLDDMKMVGKRATMGTNVEILRTEIDLEDPTSLLHLWFAPREMQKLITMLFKPKQTSSEESESYDVGGHAESVERYCEFAGKTISVRASGNTARG